MDVNEAKRDCYDEQIERLMGLEGDDFSIAIWRQWSKGMGLFACLGRYVDGCGCPTMVKDNDGTAFNNVDFTRWVQSKDIPTDDIDIQKHHLPIFAEIQRRADREFRNRGDKG